MAEGLLGRKMLGQVLCTTSLADVYAAPSVPLNAKAVVGSLWIANITAATHTITLYLGPAGVLTSSNALMEAVQILANTSYVLLGSEWVDTLDAGYHIQVKADANSAVVVTLMGAEIL